ncbi:MAG: restriction endonuclease [Syntrophales bacterium]|nr:restriction endonuclease [Syntrophales bacterium]
MSRTTILEKSISILIPPTWDKEEKGQYFEGLSAKILRRQSYDIIERIRFTGMEIDLLAKHKPSGDQIYVECKFHSTALSSNVIDLCVGQAFRKRIKKIALFSAGPLGKEAKGAIEELKDDERISFSHYGPIELIEALLDSNTVDFPDENIIPVTVSHATLIVHPENPFIWLFQDQKDGKPYRLLCFATTGNDEISNPERIRAFLDSFELLEGLPVFDFMENKKKPALKKVDEEKFPDEFVSKIITADALLDYRPCRPEDFVGRVDIQKELWDFLEKVREDETSTRLISITGGSGLGKSSLIAKLSERFKNIKWKNKFFLFPVDVRSARGPMFVAEALLQALKVAQEEGFIALDNAPVISDANSILSSPMIKLVLKWLFRRIPPPKYDGKRHLNMIHSAT